MNHLAMDMKCARSSVIRVGKKGGVLAVIFGMLSADAAADLDNSFHPQVNGTVSAIAVQPDGRILIGGFFTSVNGVARSYLARLSTNGSLDNSFAPTNGPSQFVRQVIVRDSKIYVAAGDGLRRFDMDGSVDWHYPLSVLTFDVDSQQRVIFGGQFTRVENQYHRNIARLDANGGLDAAFAPAVGCCAGEGVNTILAQGDAVLVGGSYQSVNGEPAAHLARINSDGSRDTGFNGAADPPVLALVPGGNGTVLRVSQQTLARHLSDGSLDNGFATLSISSSDERFLAAAVQSDGKSILGGNFSLNGGATRTYLVRLNSDGSIDSSFSIRPNDTVQAIAVAPDDSVLIGGAFAAVNDRAWAGIARITMQSSAKSVLNIAPGIGPNIVLSWATVSEGVLESCALNDTAWTQVPESAVTTNGRTYMTNSIAGIGRLFRLRAP
jgi:uncharacterized delta-60 repeat protein